MFRLDGKIALVTGAGQNVGAGIARTLAAQGATVVVNDYHPTRAETVCDEIRNAGGKANVAAFDVTDLNAVVEAFAGVAKELGPVDILVNNAGTGGAHGVMKMAQFRDMPTDYWQGIIDVNLFGVQLPQLHPARIISTATLPDRRCWTWIVVFEPGWYSNWWMRSTGEPGKPRISNSRTR